MTATELGAGNDVRALLFVHDGMRAAIPQAARHVRALRLGVAPADWAALEAALAAPTRLPGLRPTPVRVLHDLVCRPRYRRLPTAATR